MEEKRGVQEEAPEDAAPAAQGPVQEAASEAVEAAREIVTLPVRIVREAWDFLCFLWYAARRFQADRATSSAAALTYTSLLALVPLTTIGFSIIQAFPAFEGVDQKLRELIFTKFVPEVGEAVLGYVNDFSAKAGALTAVGICALAFTSVLVFFTIEGAFNAIWRVPRPRPLVMRLLVFWAVLTVTPLLMAASLSLSFSSRFAALHAMAETGLAAMALRLLPLLLLAAALTLLYALIPNRPVRWSNAAIGGVLAAVLIVFLKNGFGFYLQHAGNYRGIYGALATLPIFLIWLYILWSAVLAGAIVAASRPEWVSGYAEELLPGAELSQQALSGRYLSIAVELLDLLYDRGKPGHGLLRATLDRKMSITGPRLDDVQRRLRLAGWIAITDRNRLVVTMDLSNVTVYDLLHALGLGLGEAPEAKSREAAWRESYRQVIGRADLAERDAMGVSVKDILQARAGGEAG
jgi:membrane protein